MNECSVGGGGENISNNGCINNNTLSLIENNRLLMAQLASYENETEEKMFKEASSGKIYKSYGFTDRAILARAKIALKQTLGRGTYSKVKQAYDLANMRSIAVKIIDCSKAPKDFQVPNL